MQKPASQSLGSFLRFIENHPSITVGLVVLILLCLIVYVARDFVAAPLVSFMLYVGLCVAVLAVAVAVMFAFLRRANNL
jgi:hypothetical protein